VDTVAETATESTSDVTEVVDRVARASTETVAEVLDGASGTVDAVRSTATAWAGTVAETSDPVAAVPEPVVSALAVRPVSEPRTRGDGTPSLGGPVTFAARSGSSEPAPSGATPSDPTSRTDPAPLPGSGTAPRSSLDGGSSSRDAAVLTLLLVIALVLARWSRREGELRISPVFLSLQERPG
jgi:hypothetical protein